MWWIVGTAVAHDAIVAPVVTLVGLALAALLPRWARGPVATAVAASGVVVVFSYPLLRHFGRRADNPSILPLDYPRNVAIVLGRDLGARSRRTDPKLPPERPGCGRVPRRTAHYQLVAHKQSAQLLIEFRWAPARHRDVAPAINQGVKPGSSAPSRTG